WESQWVKIEQMRGERKAAVDTMGAEALARRYRSRDANFRFQTLISCMLSPQTRDQQTALAFDNLVTLVAPEPLTAQNLLAYSEQIEQACTPVSFYAVKARNIISASQRCVEQYNNDIPTDIDTLLSFKGVGPKIAYLTFTIAYGKTLGICVDTHVHRISNRLGWVDTWAAKSNGPEKTRLQLESFLPHERWENVNFLIVGFGQNVCFARNPDCGKCGLTSSC
ncbi:DNA glycosylase, partial [Ochromonadaceae sp. CCMP2298]